MSGVNIMVIRKRFIFAAVLILICTFGAIMFFEHCWVDPKRMERIIVPYEDREIVISMDECGYEYHFDSLLLKAEPLDGTLYMKDGKTYNIRYNLFYDSFTIEGKYGFYSVKSG